MFFDSGEPVCSRPSFGAIAWPPLRERQRLSQRQDFRSSITWLSDSLRAPCGAWSASSRSLPYATQDSLPAVGQTLPDGLSTRRVTIEGFKFTSCQSSSSAKFLGAIPVSAPISTEISGHRSGWAVSFVARSALSSSLNAWRDEQLRSNSRNGWRWNFIVRHKSLQLVNSFRKWSTSSLADPSNHPLPWASELLSFLFPRLPLSFRCVEVA